MRRGDYGYDAPYALVIFGLLAVASGIGAAIAWLQLPNTAAAKLTFYFVFFLANTSSFSTPPDAASSSSGTEFWMAFACVATRRYSTWDAAEARC